MNCLQVLSVIRSAGGSIVVAGDGLRVKAPPGLLTAEHKSVLAEHKAALLQLLAPAADPEREAIQWVERLQPAEGTAVVETAIREWTEIVPKDQSPAKSAIPPCTRCRNPHYRVVPSLNYPHYGWSTRRECARCKLTAAWPHSFATWYGKASPAIKEQLPEDEPVNLGNPQSKRGSPETPLDSILASPKRDPFAAVAVPSPMAGPPAAIPNYLIPATGGSALPLKVTSLTDKERDLDAKAVAAAGYAAVRSSPGFKEWTEFLGATAPAATQRHSALDAAR